MQYDCEKKQPTWRTPIIISIKAKRRQIINSYLWNRLPHSYAHRVVCVCVCVAGTPLKQINKNVWCTKWIDLIVYIFAKHKNALLLFLHLPHSHIIHWFFGWNGRYLSLFVDTDTHIDGGGDDVVVVVVINIDEKYDNHNGHILYMGCEEPCVSRLPLPLV